MTPSAFPDFLTHYYEAGERPFASLSDLDEVAVEAQFAKLAAAPLRVHRFQSPQAAREYMKLRRESEARVRQQFIEKGGRPVLKNPRYMVLGECRWFDDWYVQKAEIRIALEEFGEAQISFTYPDAMVSMVLAARPQWAAFRRPYHGVTFTKSEIRQVVATHGMPDEDNPAALHIEERLIEAQIWDMTPLERYLQPR